jgi:hypothetical protein
LKQVEEFEKAFRFFERKERGKGLKRVPDGVNDPAIFCTRTLLRKLPARLLLDDRELGSREFLALMQTPFLTQKEINKDSAYKSPVHRFQSLYLGLLRQAHKGKTLRRAVLETAMRASQHNRTGYATGDAIIYVVDTLLAKRRQLSRNEFVRLVDAFIHHQQGVPYRYKLRQSTKRILNSLLEIVEQNSHTI